jgi:hypothetical protein
MESFYPQMANINSTFFYNGNDCETPTITTKNLSISIIMDTIRESISNQYLHTFGAKPYYKILDMLVDGFVLFNLHKNKYMLKSKDELLKYINNSSISSEEQKYFQDIFLYNQRPSFLTDDEHEYIRACGTLDGYNEYRQNEDEDNYDYDTIGVLFNRLEQTVSLLTNNYSALIAE